MKFTSENSGCFVEYDSAGIITQLKLKGIDDNSVYLFTRYYDSCSGKREFKIICEYYETSIKSALQDCFDQSMNYFYNLHNTSGKLFEK